jgi:hypothetical protein
MFFSARGIIRPILRQVHAAVQQHLKTGSGVTEMHRHDAIVDLAAAAVVLPPRADGLAAALGDAGLVHAPNGVGMRVLASHNLLAAVPQLLFIPLDRFQEALQRARRFAELQGDRLGRLATHVGELSLDINLQQRPRVAAAKTVGEQSQKRNQLPSQLGNLL